MGYLSLTLLFLVILFPKLSIAGHQNVFAPECSSCHSNNRIIQHGGFRPSVCLSCHDSQLLNIKETIAKGKMGQPVYCVDCHGQINHSYEHDRTFLPAENCANCHTADVSEEHGNNGLLTCVVCHNSTDPQVQSAISYGKAGNPIYCFACHWIDHTEAHEVSGQSAFPYASSTLCIRCHVDNIAIEHLNRSLSCETCHASTDPAVQAAISNGISGTLATCYNCHPREICVDVHHTMVMEGRYGCLDCHDVH